MSESAILTLVSIAVTILLPVIGWMARCLSEQGKRVQSLEGHAEYLLNEVGREHADGMRGRLHHLENRERAREVL